MYFFDQIKDRRKGDPSEDQMSYIEEVPRSDRLPRSVQGGLMVAEISQSETFMSIVPNAKEYGGDACGCAH